MSLNVLSPAFLQHHYIISKYDKRILTLNDFVQIDVHLELCCHWQKQHVDTKKLGIWMSALTCANLFQVKASASTLSASKGNITQYFAC